MHIVHLLIVKYRKEGNFGNLLQSHQSFIRQLLVTSEIAIEAGLEFAKVYFANSI